MTMIPAALECGFGELGKHGSIVNTVHSCVYRPCVLICRTFPIERTYPAPTTFVSYARLAAGLVLSRRFA